ncbi:MAG TPA: nuclear transport factor 2 family protein [Stellaceae bacterium]|nr:nuclear transport factor 2 family protein [Stellaceae bacterium]
MKPDRAAVWDLLAEYGALIDMAKFDEWLDLFAEECRYRIVPRENFDRGLPGGIGLLRQPRDARRPHPGIARSQQIQHPHRSPYHRPAAGLR